MCKVYNTIGSLKIVKKHLAQKGINSFKSIHELLSFQENYSLLREQTVSRQKILIGEEKDTLHSGIIQLENEIINNKIEIKRQAQVKITTVEQQLDTIAGLEKGYIEEFTFSFKALYLVIKKFIIKIFTNLVVHQRNRHKNRILTEKRKRFQFISSHFEEAVRQSSGQELVDLDYKKQSIDEITSYIYGSIGEHKVAKELEQLSDDYTLINDFSFSFNKGVYSKQDQQYIKSVQIDHLLISPAGLFIIETKNWSKDSVQNLSLHSPVDQIKRANYAMFRILSGKSNFSLDHHHWGERKIPIKNIIVLIRNKPTEDFQYVKILTLNELLGYIEYFKPSLSSKETQELATFFIRKNQSRDDVKSDFV